ncbi:MAG TPA: hypothetical protein VK633_13795 [Verrucomicrobiae bacterium]|nr:hypothetical protein [Verrucomicrobiae bacterium]
MNPKHKKLGRVGPSPNDPLLNMRKRMPGWYPDEIDHKDKTPEDDQNDPDPAGDKHEVLFPEEALMQPLGSKYVPFQPGLLKTIEDATRWTFGQPLNSKPDDEFDERLDGLLTKIREYNVRLYDMRWHHLHLAGNTNPNENLTIISCQHEQDPAAAQDKWCQAVRALRKYLHEDHKNMIIDVVEVNKYIVSVRVIEMMASAPGTMRTLQLGGSSSSHMFIPFP